MSKAATKALIDANITANGTQAITGPILNNVLNTMVDDYGTQEELSLLAQEVSMTGVKSTVIETASIELRGGLVSSTGLWSNTVRYRHIIIPVSPGITVQFTANAKYNAYYAFLTSDETPVNGVNAPLLPGTERVLVPPTESVSFTIPEGTTYLYLYGGDVNSGTSHVRDNLPGLVTFIKTLEWRLSESEATKERLTKAINERTVNLANVMLCTGALSAENVWLNAARYYHVLVPVMAGDVITITAGSNSARYGFFKTDVQAMTGNDAPVVAGTTRETVAAGETIQITIPRDCNYLYLYGGDGSLGKSHTRENLPAALSIKSSIGAVASIVGDSGEMHSGGIIAANPDIEWLPKLVSAKKRYYTSSVTDKPSPVVFAHLSDIHGNWANVKRFIEFTNRHRGYIDGLLNTGDTASGLFTDGIYNSYIFGDSVASIMNVVGNHDTRGADGWQQYVGLDVYNALIAPYVESWGVTQPEDAAENGYCYYYKDYTAQSLRLVVVDIMGYDALEDLWLAGVLSDARTKGYHVVIATHFSGARDEGHQGEMAFNVVECNYTTLQIHGGNASGLYGYNQLAYMMTPTVKDFIDSGGIFVGYIQGHYHLDFVAKLTEDPRQLIYAVGSSKVGETRDYNHIGATRMQDEFQIVSIDTYMKTIRLFKVGANIDQYGREKNSVCVNYETGVVLAQGF